MENEANDDSAVGPPSQKKAGLKVFLILWLMGSLAVPCVVPYALSIQKIPVTQEILLRNLLNGSILMAVVVAVGLFLSRKAGLKTPLLDALVRGEKVGILLKQAITKGVPLGLGVGIVIILMGIISGGTKSGGASSVENPAVWMGFLASFYGAICEELQCRFVMMSLFVWLLALIRKESRPPSRSSLWAANVFAAVLFGAAHLPAAASITPLTPLVVLAVIIPNAICGLAFGYLFFSLGLEAAMIAHFSTDIVLHVIAPMFMSK